MSDVRIYKPTKSAMQSGLRNTQNWVLEYEPGAAKVVDPLMGWIGSTDTKDQVRLTFSDKEDAVAFAKKNGLAYRIQEPRPRHIKLKNYAENFGFRRPF
ncbi:MAG: ETC complex I subunit [Proteobacteria bacterium]|nr:ETC complex I subunit [Pseudomonadota bacterium]MDA1023144.1 ETC complex I subunit [Pseudomonadota bacterium]